jgi:hypothetical protein
MLALGSRPDLRLWRNSTGSALSFDGKRVMRFGLPGSPDLIGILRGGRFLGIEVKAQTGTQSAQQRAFQNMAERMGGAYILARSVEDAMRGVDRALRPTNTVVSSSAREGPDREGVAEP